ncbi:hypothetical protein FHS15_003194 [Paenibacillus castaneae]|nr:hypothetical protein [Paenibacillus castaneae]
MFGEGPDLRLLMHEITFVPHDDWHSANCRSAGARGGSGQPFV